MEIKMTRTPFNLELAKKITNGECNGKVMTCKGKIARIICFNRKSEDFPIVALLGEEEQECETYKINGINQVDDALCGKDLILEVPEYMTFKDGDVIAYDEYPDIFFVIGGRSSLSDENPNYYIKYDKGDLSFGLESSFCRLKDSRLATEEERQKFIDALKVSKKPQAKVYLKRFFSIEEKPECEFKPFDKVLVRFSLDSEWCASIFSHKNEYRQYICCGSVYNQCIPYNEQTAHLLGTTENYE